MKGTTALVLVNLGVVAGIVVLCIWFNNGWPCIGALLLGGKTHTYCRHCGKRIEGTEE